MSFKMFSSIWHIHHVNAFDSQGVLLRFDDEGAELRDHVARHLTDARSPRSMRREKTKLQRWRRPTVAMLRARIRSENYRKSTV